MPAADLDHNPRCAMYFEPTVPKHPAHYFLCVEVQAPLLQVINRVEGEKTRLASMHKYLMATRCNTQPSRDGLHDLARE